MRRTTITNLTGQGARLNPQKKLKTAVKAVTVEAMSLEVRLNILIARNVINSNTR
ncbi:hypothetical protein NG798_02620 [Ancylothrix sp. C2]|nr:hypothetical protein [Ancylothrix sp. D3o]